MMNRSDKFFMNPKISPPWLGILAATLLGGCVTTQPSARNEDPPRLMRGVLLDPGHGGEPAEAAARNGERFVSLSRGARQGYREECYGAIAASGYKEKTANLAVAQKVKALLQKTGIATGMTRSTDTYVPLEDRVATALSPAYRDHLFVSIHFNRSSRQQQAKNLSAAYRAPRGFEIYILPSEGARHLSAVRASSGQMSLNRTRASNRLLAGSLEARLRAINGLRSRGIKEASFMVLRGSPLPGVLIEGGFLSNPEEGVLISKEEYQWTLARAIVAGIEDYRMRTTTLAMNSPSAPPPALTAKSSKADGRAPAARN